MALDAALEFAITRGENVARTIKHVAAKRPIRATFTCICTSLLCLLILGGSTKSGNVIPVEYFKKAPKPVTVNVNYNPSLRKSGGGTEEVLPAASAPEEEAAAPPAVSTVEVAAPAESSPTAAEATEAAPPPTEAVLMTQTRAEAAAPPSAEGGTIIFTVSGAAGRNVDDGSSAEPLNGEWFLAGMKNGKPIYRNNAGAGAQITWESTNSWAFQNVGTPGVAKWTALVKNHHRYFNEQDMATPPTSGWGVLSGLASGDFTLEYTAQSAVSPAAN